MSYTPTTADLDQLDTQIDGPSPPQAPSMQSNQNRSYVPTSTDLDQLDTQADSATPAQAVAQIPATVTQPASSPYLQTALNLGKAAGVGLQRFAGNNISTIGNMISGSVNGTPNQTDVGDQVIGAVIRHAGNYLSNAAPNTWNLQNPTIGQQIVSSLAQYAPYAAIPGIGEGVLGSVGTGIIQGALAGASQNPNSPLRSGLIGAAGGSIANPILSHGVAPVAAEAISPLMLGINALRGIAPLLTQDAAKDESGAIFQGLSQGNNLNSINRPNLQALKTNFKAQTDNATDNFYQPLSNAANTRGYNGIDKQISGIAPGSPQTIPGVMERPDPLNTTLNGLKNQPISDNLQSSITQFQTQPSYDNAHALQSALGKERSNILSQKNVSDTDKELATNLYGSRNSVNSAIQNTFKNNGDSDLAQMHTDATNNYAQNVAPYLNGGSITRYILGKGTGPKNIINTLSSDSTMPNGINPYEQMVNHIAQNPEQSASFLAQAMKKGVTTDAQGNYQVPSHQTLATNFNAMDSRFKQLAPPQLGIRLAQLAQAQPKAPPGPIASALQNVKQNAKSKLVGGTLAGLGFGGGMGVIHHYLD